MRRTGDDPMMSLERLLGALRDEYYEVGRGDDFEEHITRLKAEGEWPFLS